MAEHFSAELKQMPPCRRYRATRCGIPHTIYRIMSGIKYVITSDSRENEYLFFNAPLRNVCRSDIIVSLMRRHPRLRFAQSGLNAIFSQAENWCV